MNWLDLADAFFKMVGFTSVGTLVYCFMARSLSVGRKGVVIAALVVIVAHMGFGTWLQYRMNQQRRFHAEAELLYHQARVNLLGLLINPEGK